MISSHFKRHLAGIAHAAGALRLANAVGDRAILRLDRGLPRPSKRDPSRFLILIYHRVVDRPSPFTIDTVATPLFRDMMGYAARHFTVIGLEEILERLDRGASLPPRTLAVTFDDGYEDNYLHAFPALQLHGIKATFFLTAGLVDTDEVLWFDRVLDAFSRSPLSEARIPGFEAPFRLDGEKQRCDAALSTLYRLMELPERQKLSAISEVQKALEVRDASDSQRRMLRWTQVEEMAEAGMEFGSHSLTHPIMTRIGPEDVDREVGGSKRLLEAHIRRPMRLFAYPSGRPGDYSPTVIEALRRWGYAAALTTSFGPNYARSPRFALSRIRNLGSDLASFAATLTRFHVCD